jgi:TonB-linked SusC/RagA family outer membrane protein
MKRIIFYLLAIQLFTVSVAHAQGRQVTGQITDSTGQAIVSASVVEKGQRNGTATDQNGNFKINLRGSNNTLVITAVGYTTKEIAVGNSQIINTRLNAESAKDLADVVVVAYGRQKKITVTGAISSVSGKELRENPSTSLQNTLSGRLPGFTSQQISGRPGADGAAFYIRGVSSYNTGSNQPLIVVDDIEYSYDMFARLDPNEIETLSILKDASTTAVFGIKGANGVVVVTTRRGKSGPPQITFRGETALTQPAKIPKYLDAYQSAKLLNQAQINDNEINPVTGFKPYFTDTDLELYKNGTDPYGHPNVDWRSVLFKKFARQYRGNFDITGGSERVRYFISAGYLYQDGMLKNYSKDQDVNGNYYHQRFNFRSNLDLKVTRTTDLRVDLYGNIGETNSPQVGSPFGYNDIFYEYSSFLSLAPFAYPVTNPNGTFGYSNWQRNNFIGGSNYNVNNVVGRLTYYGYNRTLDNNINFITSANQKLDFITKGLSLKGTVAYISGYEYRRNMTRDQFPSFIYNATANTYEARDANVYRVRRFFIGYDPRFTSRTVNLQGSINYDRTFGRHHVYALALVNQNSVTTNNANVVYNFVPNNSRGLTGRVGYNFSQKYLFEFNSGYNGSDRFSADRRYGFFPAASAGWNISEESFFHVKFIDGLKIRGSYGLVGNDRIGNNFAYYYQQTYSNSGNTYFGTQPTTVGGIQEGTLSNLSVTWEKERKLDIGIDISMFKNSLTINADYFDNNRYDILTTRGTVSAVFGQGLPPVNLGEVNNRGFEVEVNYNNTIGKDISYRLKGTYSIAKNQILFQDEATYAYPYQAYTGNSIGQQRVYQWIGFYKDADDIAKSPVPAIAPRPGDLKYADLNGDNIINDFDMAVSGYPNVPNTVAGFQFGFTYKNFSLNVFFQAAMNFNVRGVSESIRAFASNLTELHTKAWTPQIGDAAQYPRLSLNGGLSDPLGYPSTFWLVSGDYLRLKTADISYSLPQKWVNSLKMKSIRVYSNGFNLLTWTKLSKRYEFDPEISPNSDRILYPPQRTINFGISATF